MDWPRYQSLQGWYEMNKEYSDFLTKVDGFVSEKSSRFASDMNCKQGCFECCSENLTVTRIEADAIESFIKKNNLHLPAKALKPGHCKNLDELGACLIYPVRPLVCRTHGLPVDYKSDEETKHRSVCPKNFQELELHSLSSNDVLNGDTLNLLLGVLNMKNFGKIERVHLEKIGR